MIDRNCRKITRQDIAEWQESMNKCAECVNIISRVRIENATQLEQMTAAIKSVEYILHDMAFMVAYIDSTLTAEYEENVNIVAVELQKQLDKKCKGA